MQVELVGVHKVRKRLASGDYAEYYYAWRGGPRIKAKPNTDAFTREFIALTKEQVRKPDADRRNIRWLIQQYRQSPEFRRLRDITRKDYERHLTEIEAEFSDMKVAAVTAMGMRAEFLAFRDKFSSTPRRADLIMAVLRRLLSYAQNRELIERNPLLNVEELAEGSRREAIWTDGEITAFLAVAPEHMRRALMLAMWTGQRQGDLLRLTWGAYDGTHIRLRQSKTRRQVRVKVSDELRRVLEEAKRINDSHSVPATTILTNASGQPWRTGFKGQWRKTAAKARVENKTFHDLRGTFCTQAYRAGASFKEIAEASGHSEMQAERIIRTHYLAGDSVIEKIEAGTSAVNRPESRKPTALK